jgi:hypothetical protein
VLRAGDPGVGARLDEPGRRDGRPYGGGQAARAVWNRGAEAALFAVDGHRCGARDDGPHRPGGGSDLQNMSTTALPDGADQLVVNGSKTWISNARRSGLIALLCKTDPSAQPRYKGISVLLVEHGSGLTVSRDLPKLGYKGVETCELSFDNYRALVSAILGGQAGKGFSQMMKGLETGRIQVASRALGVATAAFDDALAYAQQRVSFGQPISKHQASATIWPTWRPNSPPRANSPATPPSATTAVSAATNKRPFDGRAHCRCRRIASRHGFQ